MSSSSISSDGGICVISNGFRGRNYINIDTHDRDVVIYRWRFIIVRKEHLHRRLRTESESVLSGQPEQREQTSRAHNRPARALSLFLVRLDPTISSQKKKGTTSTTVVRRLLQRRLSITRRAVFHPRRRHFARLTSGKLRYVPERGRH